MTSTAPVLAATLTAPQPFSSKTPPPETAEGPSFSQTLAAQQALDTARTTALAPSIPAPLSWTPLGTPDTPAVDTPAPSDSSTSASQPSSIAPSTPDSASSSQHPPAAPTSAPASPPATSVDPRSDATSQDAASSTSTLTSTARARPPTARPHTSLESSASSSTSASSVLDPTPAGTTPTPPAPDLPWTSPTLVTSAGSGTGTHRGHDVESATPLPDDDTLRSHARSTSTDLPEKASVTANPAFLTTTEGDASATKTDTSSLHGLDTIESTAPTTVADPDASTPTLDASRALASDVTDLGPSLDSSVALSTTPLANGPSSSSTTLPPVSDGNAWRAALAQQVTTMVTRLGSSDGTVNATLRLNPPDLGPLRVTIQMTGDTAQASFVSPHADVRTAVTQSLTELRSHMAQQGLTLGDTHVGDDASNAEASFFTPPTSDRSKRTGPGSTQVSAVPVPNASSTSQIDVFA